MTRAVGPYSPFIYTASGGEKITFRNMGTNEVGTGPGGSAFASKIEFPNGIVDTLTYDTSNRLLNVVSNAGYALIFEYVTVSSKTVSKVCGINLAQQVISSTCPSGVPTVTYTYSGSYMTSITDVRGNVWTITRTAVGYQQQEKFFRPGEATPYLTNLYDGNPSTDVTAIPWIVNKQTFADGHEYVYHWNTYYYDLDSDNYLIYGLGYTENGTLNTNVSFAVYDMMDHHRAPVISTAPEAVTDPLGRTSNFYYCVSCLLQRLFWQSAPLGMKQYNSYDPSGNVVGTSLAPNTGSSLSSLTTSASFDCTTQTLCKSPIYRIDPKGNQTDFTYDATHGGVLTESAPADANGIRSVKRYAYAQRYAWITSGSSYVQAASPIWVMTEMRTCLTSATASGACSAGPSDEVITAYDYGPNSGPNNLLLRGVAVTAGGTTLRTCYGYDGRGNRIFETKPSASLAACS